MLHPLPNAGYLLGEARNMYRFGMVKHLVGNMHSIPHIINLLLFIAVYGIRLASYIVLSSLGTPDNDEGQVGGVLSGWVWCFFSGPRVLCRAFL